MTISNGEKILVDHAASGMQEIPAQIGRDDFPLFSEVQGGSSLPAREVIVASAQITLVRPLGERSMQGSNFRPKR